MDRETGLKDKGKTANNKKIFCPKKRKRAFIKAL
jgi:hypothetical protein